MKYFIYPFPWASSNAYIRLLYEAIGRNPSCIVHPAGFAGIFAHRVLHLFSSHIIHLHWEHNLYGSRFGIVALIKCLTSLGALLFLHAIGVRICWTMHNFADHSGHFPRLDRLMRWFLNWLADGIIIQQRSVADKMRKNNAKIQYVPHGNYIGVYGPRREDRAVLRSEFNISMDAIVLVALGPDKRYKRFDAIADVVTAAQDARLTLLMPKKFVPNPDIPRYLGVADYAIFCYDNSVLTSGQIILALSYGVPVIAQDTPASEMIRNGINGYVYRAIEDLPTLLKDLSNRQKLDVQATIGTVHDATWDTVARQTIEVYQSL